MFKWRLYLALAFSLISPRMMNGDLNRNERVKERNTERKREKGAPIVQTFDPP